MSSLSFSSTSKLEAQGLSFDQVHAFVRMKARIQELPMI
jgi:hypothetical protein